MQGFVVVVTFVVLVVTFLVVVAVVPAVGLAVVPAVGLAVVPAVGLSVEMTDEDVPTASVEVPSSAPFVLPSVALVAMLEEVGASVDEVVPSPSSGLSTGAALHAPNASNIAKTKQRDSSFFI